MAAVVVADMVAVGMDIMDLVMMVSFVKEPQVKKFWQLLE